MPDFQLTDDQKVRFYAIARDIRQAEVDKRRADALVEAHQTNIDNLKRSLGHMIAICTPQGGQVDLERGVIVYEEEGGDAVV